MSHYKRDLNDAGQKYARISEEAYARDGAKLDVEPSGAKVRNYREQGNETDEKGALSISARATRRRSLRMLAISRSQSPSSDASLLALKAMAAGEGNRKLLPSESHLSLMGREAIRASTVKRGGFISSREHSNLKSFTDKDLAHHSIHT